MITQLDNIIERKEMDDRFLIGIILDSTDSKIRDIAKLSFVLAFDKDEIRYDLVYFYKSDDIKVPNRLSKTIAKMIMAKSEKFKLCHALSSTFNIIDNEIIDDYERWVIVVTDNYKEKDEASCSSVLKQQQYSSYVFFGVGEKYDRKSLEKLGVVNHVDNPNDLKEEIAKFIDKLIEERSNGRYV
jgi:hypothetical protein